MAGDTVASRLAPSSRRGRDYGAPGSALSSMATAYLGLRLSLRTQTSVATAGYSLGCYASALQAAGSGPPSASTTLQTDHNMQTICFASALQAAGSGPPSALTNLQTDHICRAILIHHTNEHTCSLVGSLYFLVCGLNKGEEKSPFPWVRTFSSPPLAALVQTALSLPTRLT